MTKTLSLAAGREPETVRQLVADATALLAMPAEEGRHTPLERIGRLRDEFHVTANRIARFKVDHCPVVDPVRISAPRATTAVLGPAQLLVQLNIAADRLIPLLENLSVRDWLHVGRAGDRVVTLGELVDGVLDDATRDLLEILDRSQPGLRGGVVVLPDRTPRLHEELPHAASM